MASEFCRGVWWQTEWRRRTVRWSHSLLISIKGKKNNDILYCRRASYLTAGGRRFFDFIFEGSDTKGCTSIHTFHKDKSWHLRWPSIHSCLRQTHAWRICQTHLSGPWHQSVPCSLCASSLIVTHFWWNCTCTHKTAFPHTPTRLHMHTHIQTSRWQMSVCENMCAFP